MIGSILRVALFVALGPAIGLVVFTLYVGLFSLAAKGTPSDFSLPALLEPSNHRLAYFYGGPAALLDGIFAGMVARRMRGLRYWLAVGGVGALVAAIGCVALGLLPIGGITMPIVFALCGLIAGLACAALFDGLAALARRA